MTSKYYDVVCVSLRSKKAAPLRNLDDLYFLLSSLLGGIMTHQYGKIFNSRLFGMCLLAVVETKALFAASALEARRKPVIVSLADVLAGFSKRSPTLASEEAQAALAKAKTAVDSRQLPAPFSLNLQGETVPKDLSEGRVQVSLKQKIVLGINESAVGDRYKYEAKAAVIASKKDRREKEIELSQIFVELRKRQAIASADQETLAVLSTLIDKAKRAARLGTLGSFFATRWQLQFDNLKADLQQSRSAFSTQAKSLSQISGLDLPSDLSLVSLAPLPASYREVSLSEESFLPAQESLARQGSLAAQASQRANLREIEAGLGLSRDLAAKTTGIFFEIDIPLGVVNAAQSEIHALRAEQDALKAESAEALRRANDSMVITKGNLARLDESVRVMEGRAQDISGLLGTANKAFASGQGDIAEVIETARELHEAKLKLSELRVEQEETILTLYFMTMGDRL